jgi:tight adherence protein C
MDSILLFLVAAISFYVAFPYAQGFIVRAISDYRVFMRIKRIVNPAASGFDDDDKDIESIGLGKKGPAFGSNELFNRIAELDKDMIEEMQHLLLKAGMRQENAMEEFMKSKFVATIALFFILFLVLTTNDFGIPFWGCFPLSAILAIFGGHRLTNMNLEMLANKRLESLEHGLPDLIDLLVICTESGLDLNRSIRRIAREMRTSNPILADELSLTSIELEMIPDHKQVFENLEKRTDCLQIKTLSKTLSQSIEYGSSLAVSLRDLAVESRQKRMLDAEARAAQAPTLLTLPMMFFIMPCLFIVMLGPVIVGMIKSFSGSGA